MFSSCEKDPFCGIKVSRDCERDSLKFVSLLIGVKVSPTYVNRARKYGVQLYVYSHFRALFAFDVMHVSKTSGD